METQERLLENTAADIDSLEKLNSKGLIEGHKLAIEKIQSQTKELLDFIVDDLLFEAERVDEAAGVDNSWLRQELIDLNIFEEDRLL